VWRTLIEQLAGEANCPGLPLLLSSEGTKHVDGCLLSVALQEIKIKELQTRLTNRNYWQPHAGSVYTVAGRLLWVQVLPVKGKIGKVLNLGI